MKNRSENCWLIHRRMVAAVATTSAQRQPPCKTPTRVTSASCRLPMPACGSSNSIRVGAAAALSDADIIYPQQKRVRLRFSGARENDGYCSKPFGILALASAAARAVIQPSRKALSSDGGLALPYSVHAAASTSWRLSSALLWASCSTLHWPASF